MTPSECARRLAEPFGVAVTDDSFVVARAGRTARITVDSNSGTTSGVTITAFGRPLPPVAFTHESSFERFGKATRIAREAQLGDPDFDPQVYVDSPLDDVTIRWLLGASAARRAILALLGPTSGVTLGESGIVATNRNEQVFLANPARLIEVLETLFALDAALPPDASARRMPEATAGEFPIATLLVGILLLVCSFTSVLIDVPNAGLFRPSRLAFVGMGYGVAAFVALAPLVALVVSGRSDSFRRFVTIALPAFFTLLFAGPVALERANALADTSPVETARMPIVHAAMRTDDDDEAQLYVRFVSPIDPAETIELPFGGVAPPPAGNVVHVRFRRGAFGHPYRVEAFYGP